MPTITSPAKPLCLFKHNDVGISVDFVFDPRFRFEDTVVHAVDKAVISISSFAAFSSVENAVECLSLLASGVIKRCQKEGTVTYITGSRCYPPDDYEPSRKSDVFVGLSLDGSYEMYLESIFGTPFFVVSCIDNGSIVSQSLTKGISKTDINLWTAWLIAEERGFITSDGKIT